MKKMTGGSMHNLGDWAASGIFSSQGEYDAIVRTNAGCHREAAHAALQELIPWLETKNKTRNLKMLDIACGTATPFCVKSFLEGIRQLGFKQPRIYHGIDINQSLAEIKTFDFPDQVKEQKLIVGNAYVLKDNPSIIPPYDLVFAGLNLHHLSDQELVKVITDIYSVLSLSGIFIIHDIFRPLEEPHSYRPKGRAMIDGAFLKDIPEFPVEVSPARPGYRWIVKAVDALDNFLKEKGVSSIQRQVVSEHVLSNDYPLAMKEFDAVMRAIGFSTTCYPIDKISPEHPLSRYFAVIIGRKTDLRQL